MALLLAALDNCSFVPAKVLSGAGPGADALGERWAAMTGTPCQRYPANWEAHGRAAGPIRNALMAGDAQALIALWDGKSPGTKNMIALAKKRGLWVHVELVELVGQQAQAMLI